MGFKFNELFRQFEWRRELIWNWW